MNILETPRLILRTWEEKDIEDFYLINLDPKVQELLMQPLSRDEVRQFIENWNRNFEQNKFSLFAAELKSTHELIGFIGLNIPKWESHFTPCVEVGWRLGSHFWGNGYATEGARACIDYGFNKIGLKEIVSFTVPHNIRSIRVMEKCGLQRDMKGDFAHPRLESTHPLSHHVLYRISN